MSLYKDYEDWKKQNELKYSQLEEEVQEDITPGGLDWDSLKLQTTPRDRPELLDAVETFQYGKRKIGPGMEVTGQPSSEVSKNWVDSNPLTDFLGNALWGFGESFVVPTVIDIAGDVSGAGDLSAAFGSQDWKDESWAGRAGYALGTGAGILTGIGAVGKVLGLTSKAAGAGIKLASKQVTRKLAQEGLESLSDDIAEGVVRTTRETIKKASKEEIKDLKWYNKGIGGAVQSLNPFASARKSIVHNPLSNPRISSIAREEVTESVAKLTQLPPGSDKLARIVDTVLEESATSLNKHFGHSLAYSLSMRTGMNSKVAQLIGDVAYEAVLLGVWDTVAGEAGDLTAEMYGLSEEEWGYEHAYNRAIHGMKTGAILAPIRYIPGGKQVAFGHSGMVADLASIGKLIKSRFKPIGNYSNNQILGFVNSIAVSTGKKAEKIFGSVAGYSRQWLEHISKAGYKMTAKDRDILNNMFKVVQGDMPKLMQTLVKEIGKDGIGSFTRASAGSFAMNYAAYKDAWDNGYWMTEDYPLDKIIADHWIGMLYMKGGKHFGKYATGAMNPGESRFNRKRDVNKIREIETQKEVDLFGRTPTKRYYAESGLEMDGSEITRFFRAYDVMNKSKEGLESYNRYIHLDIPEALKHLEQQSYQKSSDVKMIVDIVREKMISGKENQIIMERDAQEVRDRLKDKLEYDSWETHVNLEIDRLQKEIETLSRAGDVNGAAKVKKEVSDLIELNLMTLEIFKMARVGRTSDVVSHMTKDQALDFVRSFKDLKLKDGSLLTMDTFGQVKDAARGAQLEIAASVEGMAVEHAFNSLMDLGLADKGSMVNGRLVVHESVERALMELKKNPELFEAAHTLMSILHAGKNTGIIEYSDAGRKFDGYSVEREGNKNAFLDRYNKNTENIHELVFNSGPGTESGGWRVKLPGWTKKEGFFDPYMLGSVPIWHSIQSAHRFRRNEQAYFSFTGTGGLDSVPMKNARHLYDFIQGKLGGNVSFRVVEQLVKDGAFTEIVDFSKHTSDKSLNVFFNQLNTVLERLNLNSSGKVSRKDITIEELTAIKEEVNKYLGDVLSKNTEFSAFMEFVSERMVLDLTGNPMIPSSLKQVILLGLSNESLVGKKYNGALNLRSAEALRQTLLSDPSLVRNSTEYQRLETLIKEYENLVQIKLESALNDKGNHINFMEESLNLKIDPFMRNDLIQEVAEMVNRAKRIVHLDLIDLNFKGGEFSRAVQKVKDQVEEMSLQAVNNKKAVNEQLQKEVMKLARDGENLVQIFELLLTRGDHIGLRSFIENSDKLTELTGQMLSNRGRTTESIKKFRETLQEYVIEAMKDRDATLRIDTVRELDNYIEQVIQDFTISDRSHRPHSGNTSISKQQYEMKWKLTPEFVDLLIYEPRKLLELNNISGPQIGTPEFLLIEKGLNKVLDGTFTIENYMDMIVDPLMKSMKTKIEIEAKNAKNDSSKMPAGTYEQFIIDTQHILTSALSSKKMPIGIYENGILTIDHTTTSNWNRGVNLLANKLGLSTEFGHILLLGGRFGTTRGWSTNMNEVARTQLEAALMSGVHVDVNNKDLLRTGDVQMIEMYKQLLEPGTGKDAGKQFMFIQLDEKTSILVPTIVKPRIIDAFRFPDSPIRKDLQAIFQAAFPKESAFDVGIRVQNFIKKHLKDAKFDKQGNLDNNVKGTSAEVIELVQIARLANAKSFDLIKHITGNNTVLETLSTMKYLALDNARSGVPLTKENLHFVREFLPRFLPKDSNMNRAYEIFMDQTFDAQGRTKPRRDLQFFDEKGDTNKFFSSKTISRDVLREQLKRNQPELTERELEKTIDHVLAHHDKLAASVMNGTKYLSMPEMVAELVAKGATKEWFLWDKGEIVGFNVAIKPIEYHHKINQETGAIEVHIGKTAYAWHPEMDKLMKNRNGEYMIDAIGFESSHKEHQRYNPNTGLIEKPGVDVGSFAPRKGTDWMSFENLRNVGIFTGRGPGVSKKMNVGGDRGMSIEAMDNVFLLDRESIFIKSISGIHDATISAGFANLMSNQSLKDLNSITQMHEVKRDLAKRYAAMAQHPLSYKEITSKLLFGQKETGDQIGRVTGVEAILAVDGLPLFEFMAPNIDKMLTSEYMGNRNMITSSVTNGSYSVMQPGAGYSLPFSQGGVRMSFGGSGMSAKEWTTPLDSFMLSSPQGGGKFAPKANEGLSFIFKINRDFLIEHNLTKYKDFAGHDFGVTLGAGGELTIIGPHLDVKLDTPANAKAFKKLQEALAKDVEFLQSMIASDPSIATIGDLALWLNGTKDKYKGEYSEYKLDAHLNGNHNTNAAYNLFTSKKGKTIYSQIHLGKVDLRQPKAGINDWVITRVEKLLDKRRGPVSEMNLLDVIDPQDADFDLDKSASMFALPGRVIKEMYTVSGYQQSTEAVFNTAMMELGLTDNKGPHADAIKLLTKQRGSLIRQSSILSTWLQYQSTRLKVGETLFSPGWETGSTRESRFNIGPDLGFLTSGNIRYKFALKDGMEMVNSLEYMKRLIKATIDVYKKPQAVDKIDLSALVWESKEMGFLEIRQFQGINDKTGKVIDFQSMSQEGKFLHKKLIKGVIEPLGELHNLALMTDHFENGTSRKLSAYEMVNRYESILNKIERTGYDFKEINGKWQMVANDFATVVDPLLSFLGKDHFRSSNTSGISELPIIQALTHLRKSQNNIFGRLPAIDDGLGQILGGIVRATPENVNRAIEGVLKDQKQIVTMAALKYKFDQARDIYADYVSRGQENTPAGLYWKSEVATLTPLIQKFNLEINNPSSIYNMHRPKKKSDSAVYRKDYAQVYRLNKEGVAELVGGKTYKPGEKVYWRKGDVVVINPKRYEVGFTHTQRIRKAMHSAFARADRRIDKLDIQRLMDLKSEFYKALKDNNIIDSSRPKDSDRFAISAEKDLAVLMDFLIKAENLSPGMKGGAMQQQFLWMLLTPGVNENVFSVVGHSLKKGVNTMVNFKSNKYNEALVFRFLQRAVDGQASRVIDGTTAKEWNQRINDMAKKAFVKELDPTLKGDVFDFTRMTRDMNDFRLLPPLKEMPNFVYDMNLNQEAVKMAHEYLLGSYYLNPFQLYQTTVGMTIKGLNNAPSVNQMNYVIKDLWGDVNNYSYKGGNIFEPLATYREKIYHSEAPGKGNWMEWAREVRNKCW